MYGPMPRRWATVDHGLCSCAGHCYVRGDSVISPHLKITVLAFIKGYFKNVYKYLTLKRFHSCKSKPQIP